MVEEKKDEEKKPEDEPKVADKVERAEKAVKSYKEFEERLDKKIAKLEDLRAERVLGGETDAGNVQEKPKKLNDTEYSEALEKGEVNPMKEDGIKF